MNADERFEYSGSTVNSLFAQRRHLLGPKFYRLCWDILRFNREAPKLLDSEQGEQSLASYFAEHGYGEWFVNRYIVPMGAAIWSMNPAQMMGFPARFFIRFFIKYQCILNQFCTTSIFAAFITA